MGSSPDAGRPARRQTGGDAGSNAAEEAVTTELRDIPAEAAADPGPEEIQDLDVTGDDADRAAAGEAISFAYSRIKATFRQQWPSRPAASPT